MSFGTRPGAARSSGDCCAGSTPRFAPAPSGEVWDLVRALPDRQRTALVLRYVADLAERDIASVMGVTRGTVASTLSDARRRRGAVVNRLDDAVEELLPTVSPATGLDRLRARVRRRRRCRVVTVVAAAAVISAGSLGIAATAGHRSGAPRISVSPTTATTAPTSPVGASLTVADDASSVSAHTAIATRSNYYAAPPPSKTSIDFLAPHDAVDRTASAVDGHGNTIRTVGASVEETGPSGTISLIHHGSSVHLRDFGDFDGDGHTDLVVEVIKNFAVVDVYIVPGSLRPGIYDPVVVGVRVPDPHVVVESVPALPRNVGDQDRDGADDLGVGTAVYSGRTLMLHSSASLPAPIRKLPAQYLGLLQLASASAPVFVVPQLPVNPVGELEVLDARNDRLDIGGFPLSQALSSGARVTGWLVNGHHIVELSSSGRDGGQVWRFDLDRACGT